MRNRLGTHGKPQGGRHLTGISGCTGPEAQKQSMNSTGSIKQVLKLLRKGSLSAVDICKKCQQRMKQLSHLNAFITDVSEEAVHQAKGIDEGLKSGNPLQPLDGIPVAVKDNFCTKGIRTTCGSHMLENFHPPYDATVVSRLKNAGAVVMGKTNLDEFAMGAGCVDSIFGPTRNPWNYVTNSFSSDPTDTSWHVAGGSSGGSAVAVATGMAMAALGSDTGGSCRVPASFCGVVAIKPTYGLLSRHGLIPLVNSLDVPGIFARNVEDAATVLNILAGHDVLDSTTVTDAFKPVTISSDSSLGKLRLGIAKEYHAPGMADYMLSAWDGVAGMLSDGGATVEVVSLPHTQYSISCYSVLCACEVASNMARYDGIEYGHRADVGTSTEELYAQSRHEGFNEVVRGRILAGNYFLLKSNYEEYFLHAQRIRRLISEDFRQVFQSGVDMLLVPVVLWDAPTYGEYQKDDNRTQCGKQDVFTQPTNLAGLPAVVIPVGLSPRGLPLGLQLIGPHFNEQQLLQVASWLEQRINFKHLDFDVYGQSESESHQLRS